MPFRSRIVLLAVFVAAGAGQAAGQSSPRRGFWIENGVGSGTARNACSRCEEVTAAYGSASHLRVGGALSRSVLLGLEIFAFDGNNVRLSSDVDPVEAENASIAPIVIWYVGQSGFFVKGGAGLARGTFTVRSAAGEVVRARGTGSGMTFGVGFDVGVLRWVALTANFGTYVTAIGDVELDGAVIDDVIATLYEAGIAVTIR